MYGWVCPATPPIQEVVSAVGAYWASDGTGVQTEYVQNELHTDGFLTEWYVIVFQDPSVTQVTNSTMESVDQFNPFPAHPTVGCLNVERDDWWDIHHHHWTISMVYLITVVLNLYIGTVFIPRKVCLLPLQPPPLHTSLQCCSPPRCPARRWAVFLYSQLSSIKRHQIHWFQAQEVLSELVGVFGGLYFRCHGGNSFCFQYAFYLFFKLTFSPHHEYCFKLQPLFLQ